MNQELFGVFYTDGGCKPARGFGGFGVHGYVYNNEVSKVGTGLKDWLITESGYVEKTKEKTNVNVVSYYDVVASIKGETTNIVAEISAVTDALQLAKTLNLTKLTILTDSEFTVDCLTKWIKTWKENNWVKRDGGAVSNKELLIKMSDALDELKATGCVANIKWIKGHSGNLGNETADYFASLGVIAAKKKEEFYNRSVSDSKGYWKVTAEINRLFSHKFWYFNSSGVKLPVTEDGKYIYYIGDHGKDDDLIAKKAPDVSYSILFMDEQEPVLEAIREAQTKLDYEKLNTIVIGKLQNIFKPKIYNNVLENGGLFLERKGIKLDLYNDVEKMQLTHELRPPYLAFQLTDIFNFLENKLNGFVNKQNFDNITDVTDVFYSIDTKKSGLVYKIKPEISSSLKSISVRAKHKTELIDIKEKITLTLGIDLPDRNTLSALAEFNPKVYVITWPEHKTSFRYATIIHAGENMGIWAGYYSNVHMHS